ncbi:hypothetical protein O1Q96_00310 (plasmid) [Streptomyces sp. Qhu-G9]|uniref:hypothetical protein n=1 Tax=Streptomyces sp. Qhu-G9 TaxID=3452799 RepID=UPI0022ABE9E7|nr:hypothetical protein [Streptomyces aurantiacus]WAU78327.1 hypothetical protein O1Q96_00310 [Streptomyces aurantiacus]
MPDTLTSPARAYAADSPLAHLLDMAQAFDAPDADEQREDAVTTAAHHVYTAYPDTLATVVDALDWQGHPALPGTGTGAGPFEPSAVAWLDGGLWLHHTLRISEDDGARDVLTLIVPCTCGHGYTDIVLDTEDVLMELLAELRPTHGLSLHDDRTPGWRSVQSLPPLGGHRGLPE